MTSAQYSGVIAALGALGVNIGQTVVGGVANNILFVGAGPVLAQNAAMTFSALAGLVVSQGTQNVVLGPPSGNAATMTNGAVIVSISSSTVALSITDGVRTVSICDGVNHVLYTAADATKWAASTPPTDVWVALDRIAAALTTLLTPP